MPDDDIIIQTLLQNQILGRPALYLGWAHFCLLNFTLVPFHCAYESLAIVDAKNR